MLSLLLQHAQKAVLWLNLHMRRYKPLLERPLLLERHNHAW